jgi:4-alpha-glucanotransferase
MIGVIVLGEGRLKQERIANPPTYRGSWLAHRRISSYNDCSRACHIAEQWCDRLRKKGGHMEFSRVSGILLHPTSLPGPFGIGNLGSDARRFVRFLGEAGQRVWQILPLGPTGHGNSPYQTYSAFAGNPLLLSLETLREEGLLSAGDLSQAPPFPPNRVDYDAVGEFKRRRLWKAFEQFQHKAAGPRRDDLVAFAERQVEWLDDYALFMALREAHGSTPWHLWERDIALREPAALEGWRKKLAPLVQFHTFLQYHFFKQWQSLRADCQQHGIQLFGDVPIFIAHDSADVWAHPELFHLDASGRPTVVAGVPPDYFSLTGQLWGNPLYRWEVMAASGYAWWIQRLRTMREMVDIIRLDHFRGFEAYWEVPAADDTAVHGRWVAGPGAAFFEAVHEALGELPIVAEDLGLITPEVRALRERFSFPGMRVLQFAFGGDPRMNEHSPHNYPRNCVVYTGTHDNNTTVGWFHEVERPESTASLEQMQAERTMALKYMASDGSCIHWDMIRLALASVANLAIIPMQDLLGLGQEARMNHPGTTEGNWQWRYSADMLTEELTARLRELTTIYGRTPIEDQQ